MKKEIFNAESEYFLQRLNSHDKKPIIQRTADFRKQSFFNEGEEPAIEPIVRATSLMKFTEGLRMFGTGIMMFADSDCNWHHDVCRQ